MRKNRWVGAGAALVLTLGLTGSAVAVEPGADTFHGTFTSGEAYWSTGPAGPVFEMPVRGTWNLNVNLTRAPGQGQPRVAMIVKYIGGGLHARWVENELELTGLTTESSIAAVIPDLVGVVNDPAHGVYAYQGRLAFLDATVVVFHDTGTGRFFYAVVPGTGYACPAPSAEVTECYDSVFVEGTSR